MSLALILSCCLFRVTLNICWSNRNKHFINNKAIALEINLEPAVAFISE